MAGRAPALALSETLGNIWSFAGREFDESRLELRVEGLPVELELKPLEVLIQLLGRGGEVATKDQLLETVWPGLNVVDASLATAVHKLRKALKDESSSIVVTVPRIGYRLGVSVTCKSIQLVQGGAPFNLEPGAPVAGRRPWHLQRALDVSSNRVAWLAEHPHTHELRVFKFVADASRLRALRREVTVFRFLRESLGERAEFVRIFEWNFDTAPYFLESEYGGSNLAEWAELQGGLAAIPLATRVAIIAEIADAVATAHAAGVLHQDLKPANILVKESPDRTRQIKVADFGSACLMEPSRLKALGITSLSATQTSAHESEALVGTLLYLAPEVISGAPATALSDVYALGVMLYQAIVGDFRRPVSTGWEETVEDPLLREDIGAATYGDAARRTKSAAEVAARLRSLDARRAERERVEKARAQHEIAELKRVKSRIRRPWIAVATVAAFLVFALIYFRKPPVAVGSTLKTVAVLPLQDIRSGSRTDFLSLAMADELATALSYARGLSVRPFSVTQKYAQGDLDPRKAGAELNADELVSGHFERDAGQLQLTLEAIEAGTGRLLWRDTIAVSANDLLELRARITAWAQGPLAVALGAPAFTADSGTTPHNQAAYDLYLRAAAIPLGTVQNKEAIAWLEQSVALDRGFAPAWALLGRRYYIEGRYGNGGSSIFERGFVAYGRAVTLAPNYIAATAFLTGMYAEGGDIGKAIDEAEDLVHRRPDNADVHYILSYAFRYAGRLDEAAAECNTAYTIDRYTLNRGLRSCAILFAARGDYRRAWDFLNLDRVSDVGKALSITTLLREGRDAEAVRLGAPHIPQWASYDMVVACAQHAPPPEIARMTADVHPSDDPEANYLSAANLAYCGQTHAAVALLKRAVEGNYCSYPAIDSDVFFAKMRGLREFAEVRTAAMACQRRFLSRGQAIASANN